MYERFTDRARKVTQLSNQVALELNLPQTSGAKRVIESALAEARSLGHNYVGTEHLLLGLLQDSDSQAARLLAMRGLTLEKVRQAVLSILEK